MVLKLVESALPILILILIFYQTQKIHKNYFAQKLPKTSNFCGEYFINYGWKKIHNLIYVLFSNFLAFVTKKKLAQT